MNPQRKFFRSMAVLAIAGIGLAACEDTIVNVPDPLPTISATPQQITLDVNGTAQIAVTVTGVAGGVSYSSANSSVATVSDAGVVTGVAAGSTTITVQSTADSNLRAGVNVIVQETDGLPATGDEEVVILGVYREGTIFPVNPNNAFGQIDVALSVDRGAARKLEVYLSGVDAPICTQTFGTSGTSADGQINGPNFQIVSGGGVVCSIDTQAFTVQGNRGVPTYPNQAYSVRAVLVDANGNELDAAESDSYTFNNDDFLVAEVDAPSLIEPDNGLLWHGGDDITVRVIPVIYSALNTSDSGYPARVWLSLDGYVNGVNTTSVQSSTQLVDGGFVLTFPYDEDTNDGGLAGFNTSWQGSDINVQTVTNGGQLGPDSFHLLYSHLQSGTALPNSVLRIDNESPDAGLFSLAPHPVTEEVWSRNGWVNGSYAFADGKEDENDTPFGVEGVGVESVEFFVLRTDGNPSAATVVAEGVKVNTVGEALDQTETNSEYVAVARVTDRLGNSSLVVIDRGNDNGQTGNRNRFGVDLTVPLIEVVDSISTRYNPNDTYGVQVRGGTDGFSGIAITRVGQTQYVCNANECTPASTTDRGVGTDGEVVHPIGVTVATVTRDISLVTQEAYHRFDAQTWNRAGTPSAAHQSIVFIRDGEDPVVSNVNIPTNLEFTGGTAYTFHAQASDNVDLRRATAGFDFGAIRLPFGIIPQSVWGPSDVHRQVSLTHNLTFIRTLSELTSPSTVNFVSIPTAARFRVWDHDSLLGRESEQANNIVPNTVDDERIDWLQTDPDPNYGLHSGELTQPAGDDPALLVVRGQTGTFNNPFGQGGRVLFYAQLTNVLDDGGNPINYLIGSSADIRVEDTGAQNDGRIWSFTAPDVPAEITDSGEAYTIIAVGITRNGDALLIN